MSKLTELRLMVLLLLMVPEGLLAQRVAAAKNVDIAIENNKAVISFDIKYRDPLASHVVDLQFLDKDYNLVTPGKLSGDLGSGITGKGRRSITWEIYNDMDLLGSEIRPVIFIDGKSREFNKPGGPGNVMFSFLLPGLGDYFVADPKLMTFKPYMRTLSSLGMIGLGFYLGTLSYQDEGEERLVLKADYWRYTGEDRYHMREFEGEKHYPLFKGDKEFFITLGAAIWAADIIWVLARGNNNRKFIKAMSRGSSFQLGYVPGGASLSYSLNF